MKNWICIRLDENNLWTADLFDQNFFIKNIGGSYSKVAQIIFDARQTWGSELNIRIFPTGYHHANINYKGEL